MSYPEHWEHVSHVCNSKLLVTFSKYMPVDDIIVWDLNSGEEASIFRGNQPVSLYSQCINFFLNYSSTVLEMNCLSIGKSRKRYIIRPCIPKFA